MSNALAETYTYDDNDNDNGGVDSMRAEPGEPSSETNVWDREFSCNLMGQFDVRRRRQRAAHGDDVQQHGGGPETIFLDAWVTVMSQIYKNVNDGHDKSATTMDAGAGFEKDEVAVPAQRPRRLDEHRHRQPGAQGSSVTSASRPGRSGSATRRKRSAPRSSSVTAATRSTSRSSCSAAGGTTPNGSCSSPPTRRGRRIHGRRSTIRGSSAPTRTPAPRR